MIKLHPRGSGDRDSDGIAIEIEINKSYFAHRTDSTFKCRSAMPTHTRNRGSVFFVRSTTDGRSCQFVYGG